MDKHYALYLLRQKISISSIQLYENYILAIYSFEKVRALFILNNVCDAKIEKIASMQTRIYYTSNSSEELRILFQKNKLYFKDRSGKNYFKMYSSRTSSIKKVVKIIEGYRKEKGIPDIFTVVECNGSINIGMKA